MSEMSRIERLIDEYMEEHSRPYRYEIVEKFTVGDMIHCVVSEFSHYGELDVTYTLTIDENEKVTLLSV